jgi:signal transduction histidine kinase
MKLTAKLILIVFLAMALLTCASAFLSIRQQFAGFQQEQERQARQLQPQVARDLARAWQERGRAGVEEAMAGMNLEVRTTKLRWVQFNVNANHPDSPSAPSDSLGRVIHGEIESVVVENKLHTYVPAATDKSNWVGVELSDSLAPLDVRNQQTVQSTVTSLVALALVCLAVVAIAGVSLVGRPLQSLLAKTQEVGRGELSRPITIPGNDELSQLGAALNELGDRLLVQKETIEEETASRIEAINQLRHANRLKTVGRLAAGIAHELGTPLNIIAGRAGLIAGRELSGEETCHSAQAIKAEADRITGIIRQLLDFARHTTLQRQDIDLGLLARRTVELLQTLAESKQVQIDVQLDSGSLIASVDETQLQQLFTNIIMNAVQSVAERGQIGRAHV